MEWLWVVEIRLGCRVAFKLPGRLRASPTTLVLIYKNFTRLNDERLERSDSGGLRNLPFIVPERVSAYRPSSAGVTDRRESVRFTHAFFSGKEEWVKQSPTKSLRRGRFFDPWGVSKYPSKF